MHAEQLERAVGRRLRSISAEIRAYFFVTFLFCAVGAMILVVLWLNFSDLDEAVIEISAGIGTSFVTIGIGGFLISRILDLREHYTRGENWRDFYNELLGPPPATRLHEVEQKILGWMET